MFDYVTLCISLCICCQTGTILFLYLDEPHVSHFAPKVDAGREKGSDMDPCH